ncbi:hypothetical protein SKAU_G00136090 [Synaphobranchus kaupii]|uniref:Uncharacterized protein n=1 Tax=Synaphobranchus kaupii TaxID=118154 RepID=A0A9Q1FSC1_SYNKA|nr:hypothetical protein SKAU_G00136090 [Synaphobranchus kaupii]
MCGEVSESDSDGDESDLEEERGLDDSEPELNDILQDAYFSKCQRMPCLAHTLQLSLEDAMKRSEPVLNRARRLVHLVRKSSVANEKIIDKCGKISSETV